MILARAEKKLVTAKLPPFGVPAAKTLFYLSFFRSVVGLPALSHVKREDNPNPKLECFHVVHVVEDNYNVNNYDNFHIIRLWIISSM